MAVLPYLQVEGLTKSHGDRMMFADLTFGINEGDKIGLIAKNGAGKSTLLKILSGQDAPDSGDIILRSGIRVGILDQTPEFNPGSTVMEAVTDGWQGIYDDLEQARVEAMQILGKLMIEDTEALIDPLSGGQRKRVALARTLLRKPDLLILDEPTNHLDIEAVEWLENYLSRSRITLLLVTHDRYFLDRVCNKIFELDLQQIFTYQGNYKEYLRRREERIQAMTGQLEKARNTLRREQDWMSRQPQARGGKAKYRIDAFYDLKDQASRNRQALRQNDEKVSLGVKSSYIGSKIFEAVGVSKRFGDKVILDDFTYTFARYEKLGIIGHNGAGKSTFIKMLQGIVPQDAGEWNVGETVRFGYYSQDGIEFDENKKVVDAITEIADDIVFNDGQHFSPMQFLTYFLFSPADQQKYIHTLSGGERCRLHLASVLMRQPNFLILDEPTNDLDILTLSILEDYLSKFKGCVIVISHDRFFLDSVVDHLFVMEGEGVIRDFPGTYTEYREYCKQRQAAETQQARAAEERTTAKPRTERARKMSFKEKKEFETLTEEIDRLTAEKSALDALFASGETIDDAAAKAARYSELTDILDEKELRWLELSELA
ncbi:MAG: ABC-F family ATP-binding cassette domain-containing protein [Bacteroides sp.]|nr:ABC-F family ATP-binding cassette domain-containing protein [Bacteroides sp.]